MWIRITSVQEKIQSLIFGLLFFVGSVGQIFGQGSSEIVLANEYVSQGEIEKALVVFKKIAKNKDQARLIHNQYFELLISVGDFKSADRHLKKLIKANPKLIVYRADEGTLLKARGKTLESDKVFKRLIREVGSDANQARALARYFYQKQLYDLSEQTYKTCRTLSGQEGLFAYELANLYVLTNRKQEMVDEYLGILKRNPDNLNYIKGIWQRVLNTGEELEGLEKKLIRLSQEERGQSIYNELLVWTYLQQRNFYGAFIQARSLEKRLGGRGERIYEIAKIAAANNEYETAAEMYAYIVDEYPHSPYYAIARRSSLKAKEEWLTSDFPVNKKAISDLVAEYGVLVREVENSSTVMEAMMDRAMLRAFYLDEYDSAIADLSSVTESNRASVFLRMSSKISLGDMYVLTGEPWEASLLYSQVEREMKDSPLSYEAKLKNAKLSYYKGEFDLAKGHLDILKEATSRKISNDAMSLSLLIKDNTGLDSTETALKRFAAIDLLMYQNKRKKVLEAVETMLYEYPSHSLEDELLFLKAKVQMEQGEFDGGVASLDRLLSVAPDDILADDALYLKAKIYEEGKEDPAGAMEVYKELMLKHPGSVFAADARKRFRKLRGDVLR